MQFPSCFYFLFPAEKVIILICGSCFLPQKDEEIVQDHIERVIDKKGRGFTMWLKKHGKLAIDPHVLLQLMTSISVQEPPRSHTEDLQARSSSFFTYSDHSQGYHTTNQTLREQQMKRESEGAVTTAIRTSFTTNTPHKHGELVMLKSKLYNGIISYQPKDLEILSPGFEVPDNIRQMLLHKHCDTPKTGVKITSHDGVLQLSVDSKSKESSTDKLKIAENETMMLITCVRNGEVSLEKGDLQLIYPDWQIPQYLKNTLKREYETIPIGDLYIISDELGNLRHKVFVETTDKVIGRLKKAWKTAKSRV